MLTLIINGVEWVNRKGDGQINEFMVSDLIVLQAVMEGRKVPLILKQDFENTKRKIDLALKKAVNEVEL